MRIVAGFFALAMVLPWIAWAQEEPDAVIAPAAECVPVRGFEEGFRAGTLDGRRYDARLWLAGGAFGGLSGPLGCLAATGAGYGITPKSPNFEPGAGDSEPFKEGYRKGYRVEVRKRRAANALVGGTAGVMVVVAGYAFLGVREYIRHGGDAETAVLRFGTQF